MSVTIRDVMKLPCMRNAEIAAGQGGLDNIVTAVSVLEYSSYSDLQEKAFSELNYEGSDLVITAFSSICGKPGKILAEIMNSHAIGEAGVIIYYFDLFVKKLEKEVLDYANEVGFPIIVMPKDQFQLRYSEAISEIQGLIIDDRKRNEDFTPFITETFVSLPKNQQNISALLRLLSNYLHLTFIMEEPDGSVRAFAGWPNILEREASDILSSIAKGSYSDRYEILNFDDIPGQEGRLAIIARGQEITPAIIEHVRETARLILKMLANEKQESIGSAQLIRAIINDEPIKMRRLARNQGIDHEKLRNMIICRNPHITPLSSEIMLSGIKEIFGMYCRHMVADIYSDDAVVFLDDGISSQWLPTLKYYGDFVRERGLSPILAYARGLSSPSEVRKAYLDVSDNIEVAKSLYRSASVLSYHEILYVKRLGELISEGEDALRDALDALKYLSYHGKETEKDLSDTLSCFYFDAYMSVSKTAESMNLHVNTVKYRLKKISAAIGCHVTDMPEMQELYMAMALKRLLGE